MEEKRTRLLKEISGVEAGLGKGEEWHQDLLDQAGMTDLTVGPRAINRKQTREGPMVQDGEEMIGLPMYCPWAAKPEYRGQTSHGLEKSASPGLLFHSCQHRPVKGSAECTSHMSSSELAWER